MARRIVERIDQEYDRIPVNVEGDRLGLDHPIRKGSELRLDIQLVVGGARIVDTTGDLSRGPT